MKTKNNPQKNAPLKNIMYLCKPEFLSCNHNMKNRSIKNYY